MRLNYYIVILVVFSLFAVPSGAQDKGEETIKFVTLGKCSQCKTRIETAVNSIDGINYVFWNYASNETVVTYDDLKTDPYIIMQTIADTGHDTEWYRAPDASYNLLVGSCCEYLRTIDYSQVQVGYLSLMGIWVSQLSIGKINESFGLDVYPTNSYDFITVSSDHLTTNMNIDIYSISGNKVLSRRVISNNEAMINISSLAKGNYMLFVTGEKKLISGSKFIKQ